MFTKLQVKVLLINVDSFGVTLAGASASAGFRLGP
jgi:hypothetical protein